MPGCGDDVRLELGMTFATKSLIRGAIKPFAMESKKSRSSRKMIVK